MTCGQEMSRLLTGEIPGNFVSLYVFSRSSNSLPSVTPSGRVGPQVQILSPYHRIPPALTCVFRLMPATPRWRSDIRSEFCKFATLSPSDIRAFPNHLTYVEEDGAIIPVIYSNLKTVGGLADHRRFVTVETKSGLNADGPIARLRSQGSAMCNLPAASTGTLSARSVGRGPQLSQILQHTKKIKEHGTDYDHDLRPPADLLTLSVLGIAVSRTRCCGST